MRCITLTQPWATLIAIGAKTIETRSWRTTYRGPLGIHAAQGFGGEAELSRWCFTDQFYFALMEFKPFAEYVNAAVRPRKWVTKVFPLGCILATCRLADCVSTSTDRLWKPADLEKLTKQETALGDYSPGRFAWILEDIKPLPEPIPAKGALSLWEWAEPVNRGRAGLIASSY